MVAPNMSCEVVDWAIQAHGAASVSQDFWLAEAYARQRTVPIVEDLTKSIATQPVCTRAQHRLKARPLVARDGQPRMQLHQGVSQ
jgi:alkylation response protein AidB-like acyl-CoA dehydrogenase